MNSARFFTRLPLGVALALGLLLALVLAACSPKPDASGVALTLEPVAGENWTLDPAQSSIRVSGLHAGKPFQGVFERYAASIRFDPADPASGQTVVLVDVGSFKTGDTFRDTNAKTEDWLDVKTHPTARFESTAVRALGDGRHELSGDLTLKGVATPATLTFTFARDGEAAVVAGGVDLDRFALGLGRASDPKEEWVARTMRVEIALRAAPKGP